MGICVVNKREISPGFTGGEYVGRPSPLGNPFAIGRDGTRNEVITKYREWLGNEWFNHPNGKPAHELRRLIKQYKLNYELTLICWCAPQACHGDVLREAIIHESV